MNSPSTFYVTGGTLRGDSPSYVERGADWNLLEGLLSGEFCYVLTSRQMGKSSLMVRACARLRQKGSHVVALDLTAIGQNLTPEQWYDGLIARMGRQLNLEEQMETFWLANERLSPVQRWISAIRDVALAQQPGPMVIFIDEIDTVRSLPFSTDEFFAAIRECYNRRPEDLEFRRLTFCLLGVATPSDLIRDTRTTPFNIGHRIELNDFTPAEAVPLAEGLRRDSKTAEALLERILYWTSGHPYLTQRLCESVAHDPAINSEASVDHLCERLFLCPRAHERDDNLLFVRERMLRCEGNDLAGLLDLYGKVLQGKTLWDDETKPLISRLRLTGIVKVDHGSLRVRNRIYQRVFNQDWIRASMPDQEARRQREAFRKGILRGVAYASLFGALSITLSQFVKKQLEDLHAALAIENLAAIYQSVKSYSDTAIVQNDISMQGAKVITSGTASVLLEKPNKINFRIKMELGLGETDLQIVSDGTNMWVYMPLQKEYTIHPAPGSIPEIFHKASEIASMDVTEPLYDLISSSNPPDWLRRHALGLQVLRQEELQKLNTHVMAWNHGAIIPNDAEARRIPVTAWVDDQKGLFRKLVIDLSKVATNTWMPNYADGGLRPVNMNGYVVTMTHTNIMLDPKIPDGSFRFTPPREARKVKVFELTKRFAAARSSYPPQPKFSQSQLKSLIPARTLGLPDHLIDLSRYYNAPLSEGWLPDNPNRNLSSFPTGHQFFTGTPFDVRGVLQLSGSLADPLSKMYPERVENIVIGRKCRQLHFMHGAASQAPDGTHIGSYLIHYANGETRISPIIYGFDVQESWSAAQETPSHGLTPAWEGLEKENLGSNSWIRIYKATWTNPLPEQEISSIDFVSTQSDAAPFLLSITAEQN